MKATIEARLLQSATDGNTREVHKMLHAHCSTSSLSSSSSRRTAKKNHTTKEEEEEKEKKEKKKEEEEKEEEEEKKHTTTLSIKDVGRVLLCLCKARMTGTSTNITMLSPKTDVILALCRHHPSVLPFAVTKRGTTALMGAALRGYAAVCQSLMEEGANVDAVNDQNQTALSFAASQGYRDVVFVLLDHGPSEAVNKQDTGGRTPLLHAISGGHVGCVQRLLEARCSTSVVDAHGRTPLLVAASAGNASLCRLLVRSGADVNFASEGGANITPLMASIENEHVACSLLLMDELRADVHLRNSQGACALTYACKRGIETVAVALVQRGVSVDSSNCRGTTPLMVAANNGHCGICRFLLDSGADIGVVNEDYATPMDCASTPDVNTMFVEYMREKEEVEEEERSSGRSERERSKMLVAAGASAGASAGGKTSGEDHAVYWSGVQEEGKRREERRATVDENISLQDVLGVIDASRSFASLRPEMHDASLHENSTRSEHRDETLRAIQAQHDSITSSFLGNTDIDPEEVERINTILAERMSRFYDLCERDNEEKLREVEMEGELRVRAMHSVTLAQMARSVSEEEERKEDFTYRPRSLNDDEEPTFAPPSPPPSKYQEEEEDDDDDDDDDDSMMSFVCPITQVRMTDPVTCMDGHTYERSGIERWLTDHDTSPLTGVKLPAMLLIPNHSLRNAIEEYRENHGKK